jgi:hypothetical protein
MLHPAPTIELVLMLTLAGPARARRAGRGSLCCGREYYQAHAGRVSLGNGRVRARRDDASATVDRSKQLVPATVLSFVG